MHYNNLWKYVDNEIAKHFKNFGDLAQDATLFLVFIPICYMDAMIMQRDQGLSAMFGQKVY